MTNTTNTTNTNTNTITPYYDSITYTMLLETLTEDDKEYINNSIENASETIETLMFTRWTTIINSLPHHYYHHYSTQVTQQDRNDWFKKYLDYPTKNILNMPDLL
jgi:hypothetical protein